MQQRSIAPPWHTVRGALVSLTRYVRKMKLAGGAPPTLLAMAPGPGMLVAHSWADLGLHVFNVNGRHLVSAEGNERLAALAVSPDGHFLLTGGQRGVASLHWLHSLEVRALSPPRHCDTREAWRLEVHCLEAQSPGEPEA